MAKKKRPNDFGLRSAAVQRTLQPKIATSVVARVDRYFLSDVGALKQTPSVRATSPKKGTVPTYPIRSYVVLIVA